MNVPVKVVHDEVHGKVIAIIGFGHDLSDLLNFPGPIGIIEIKEVPGNPCQPDECLPERWRHSEVLDIELAIFRLEIEGHRAIAQQRHNVSDVIFLPFLKGFHQLLTSEDQIIIGIEEQLRFALRGQRIAKIHGVVWSLMKQHRVLPFLQLSEAGILRTLLIVPDDDDFFQQRAFHRGIFIEELFYGCVVSLGAVCRS